MSALLEELLASPHLRRARVPRPPPAQWGLAELFGRMVELCGQGATAALTTACGLVLEAQRAGEPVVWISGREATFFPPDLEAGGIDLAALVVVRTPDARVALRAADRVLRSGGFGLVVLDLADQVDVSLPAQTRLAGLAHKHDVALLCLTERGEAEGSLGSLVSLRLRAARRRLGEGRFECEAEVLKDKRRGPGRHHREVFRGPPGLR